MGRRCTEVDGSILWGAAFYKCWDGTVWPMLTKGQYEHAPEPESAAFTACIGRP